MENIVRRKRAQDPYDLRPTSVNGVYTFALPSPDFNANHASLHTLQRYGVLPRRPDPLREPKLFAAWTRIVGRLWRPENFLPIRLEPQAGVTHALVPPRRTQGPYTSKTWCGCAIVGNWIGAFATWHVPKITTPPDAVGQALECASWVGLDGSFLPGTHSNDVLQAGVSHNLDVNGNVSNTAWFEWYPGDVDLESLEDQFPYVYQTNINIPVTPGDEVAVVVQYVLSNAAPVGVPDPPAGRYTYGAINFINVTLQKSHAFYMLPPPGTQLFTGDSAEWIMERGSDFLPKFGQITFDTAGSCNPGGAIVGQPAAGTSITMTDEAGQAQTAENLTETSLTITDIFN